MKLIASWAKDEDDNFGSPDLVWWADGSPATLQDYGHHVFDTNYWVDKGAAGTELHMCPEIVAEAYYCPWGRTWGIRGDGVIPTSLGLTDPEASDSQIRSMLSALPTAYRCVIRR